MSSVATAPSSADHGSYSRPRVFLRCACAMVAVAAAGFYFLIFAQFTLLRHAQDFLGRNGAYQTLGLLALGAAAGGFAGALAFRPRFARWGLLAGFAAAALTAFLGRNAITSGPFTALAVAAGASLGWTTVLLWLCLRPSVRLHRLGRVAGLGVGTAYLAVNLPVVFEAEPATQFTVAAVIALVGAAAAYGLRGEPAKASSSPDYTPRIATAWVLLFLVLVWLDSSLFHAIQVKPLLKERTWSGDFALFGNAFVHFCAALLAGVALDRRQLAWTTVCAVALLVGAAALLGARSYEFARVCYTAGVSAYAVAAVYYPARGERRWVAAAFLALALLGGAALGIAMVELLGGVPALVLFGAPVLAGAAYGWRLMALGLHEAPRRR